MAALSQQDIKTLEQTRQRLSHLSNSLASLQSNILQSDPLPSWTSLNSLATIISQNLSSVSTQLSTHAPLLSSMAVFPLPSYPGKTQEALLGQLLRKKLEPEVEDWVVRGRETAEKAGVGMGASVTDGDEEEKEGEERKKRGTMMLELWEWAGMAANELARGHEWGGDFTREEKEGGTENVVTGLRRVLSGGGEEDDDDDDEEGEEDEEEVGGEGVVQRKEDGNGNGNGKGKIISKHAEGVDEEVTGAKAKEPAAAATSPQAPLSLDQVMRFMTTGLQPTTT